MLKYSLLHVQSVTFFVVQEEDWWTGQIGERTGVFPFNYVEITDVKLDDVPNVQPEVTKNSY